MKKLYLKRFFAFLIDWMIVFHIGPLLAILGGEFKVEYLRAPSIKMFSAFGVILSILFFILFPLFKDVLFCGASIGKRLMKLKVVDANTHQKPKISSLVLRNILFYSPYINGIAVLLTKGKSLGDMIGNTVVTESNYSPKQ